MPEEAAVRDNGNVLLRPLHDPLQGSRSRMNRLALERVQQSCIGPATHPHELQPPPLDLLLVLSVVRQPEGVLITL